MIKVKLSDVLEYYVKRAHSHLYPLLSVVSNKMCNHIIPSTWNLFRCKNYKLCSRARAQEDLTKDQIGTKVGEMTSLLRQDCVFCETWCE